MNIHKRFVVQFFIQLIVVFILFFFILLSLWAILGYSVMNQDIARDLSEADDYFFSDRLSMQGNEVLFDEELKELALHQKSWLLVLTEQGGVIGSYNTPTPPPSQIEPSELAALLLQNSSFAIDYWSWDEETTGPQPYVLILGKRYSGNQIITEITPEVDWNNHHLDLSATALQQLEKEKGWVQLINSTGQVVDSYGTDKEPAAYSMQDLLALSVNPHGSLAAYYHSETGQTLLAGLQDANQASTLEESLFKTMSNSILMLFIVLFLLLLTGTFWYARKFGVPLITMMKWIQNLGTGQYEQPVDSQQRPIFLNDNGKLKKKYRLYKDMIATLNQLTETLQQNEIERKKITQTREEWISGLSHDLKTPLASISGYAQMLESDSYGWTEKETRDFAIIISEKSAYMMDLLEDLTLTYRLKNQALPMVKEEVDINEFIRRTLIHYINDPANSGMKFVFHPYKGSVIAALDPKWFQRVVDNLLANAVKYNPPGTRITVSVSMIEQHLAIITIEDDGAGMDSETLDKLFQRYYRGTHTRDSGSGTGLGMAITKQLVQLHGGSINVKSSPHEGTTVRIFLPV